MLLETDIIEFSQSTPWYQNPTLNHDQNYHINALFDGCDYAVLACFEVSVPYNVHIHLLTQAPKSTIL